MSTIDMEQIEESLSLSREFLFYYRCFFLINKLKIAVLFILIQHECSMSNMPTPLVSSVQSVFLMFIN